uniref:Uncharacterized protein n=1 Tax=Timema bartmani TaxID=61472 RepID=A0A7R9F522_9NEOP|nr:unnamed protein product [Timema bartmani]
MTSLVIYRQWRTCNPSSEDWDNMISPMLRVIIPFEFKAESVIDVWKSKDTIATFDSGGLYAANSAMTTSDETRRQLDECFPRQIILLFKCRENFFLNTQTNIKSPCIGDI